MTFLYQSPIIHSNLLYLRRLVELLMHSEVSVVQATLRAVGNIVTGDDVQTQVYVTHFLMIDPRIMIYMGLWDLS